MHLIVLETMSDLKITKVKSVCVLVAKCVLDGDRHIGT